MLNVNADRGAFHEHTQGLGSGAMLDDAVPSLVGAKPIDDFVYDLAIAMTEALIGAGLYTDESIGMVNTWRRQWFRTPGVRVLYFAPAAWIDASSPAHDRAPPERVVRVMVMRVEVLTPSVERDETGRSRACSTKATPIRDGSKPTSPRWDGLPNRGCAARSPTSRRPRHAQPNCCRRLRPPTPASPWDNSTGDARSRASPTPVTSRASILGAGGQGTVLSDDRPRGSCEGAVAKVYRRGASTIPGEFALLSRNRLPGLVRAHDLGEGRDHRCALSGRGLRRGERRVGVARCRKREKAKRAPRVASGASCVRRWARFMRSASSTVI